MKLVTSPEKMQVLSENLRLRGKHIGFVPTMGALHDGHLSLIRAARKASDIVVVSIFVNPIQFGPKEDYRKYPRNLEKDRKLLKNLGVDIVFVPKVKDIFKEGFDTFVEVPKLSKKLCGTSRPGHFRGVTTIVIKLFNIVNPYIAFFGFKDFQQQVIIKKMVKDLNMDIKIISLPIVRESDGLAMSSRNMYLSKKERKSALVLRKSLLLAKKMIGSGESSPSKVKKAMKRLIRKEPPVKLDYLSICNPETLEEVKRLNGQSLIALAAYVGRARLIDNITVKPRKC